MQITISYRVSHEEEFLYVVGILILNLHSSKAYV